MFVFRCLAYLPPQLLLILYFAGSYDLLGGWNQTDEALVTLIALFILSPIMAITLLAREVGGFWKTRTGKGRWKLLFITLALLLFAEALALDYYLLTQVRMH